MVKEFNLSEKIWYWEGDKELGYFKPEDVKEFIRWCEEHSFTTDEGLSVIDINKLKEGAGKELRG